MAHAFGVAGSGDSMSLVLALEERGVTYHGVSHEGAGAIMAGSVSAISHNPSASLSIKGPGLANMLPGIVHNHFETNPALSISESFGPGIPAHRKHKRLDQPSLVSTVVKAVSGTEEGVEGLLDIATAEVPGPVHLELGGLAKSAVGAVSPNEGADSKPGAPRLPTGVHRPAVVAGSLAARRYWGLRLSELSIPVFTTAAAKGLIDEASPYSAGVFTGNGLDLTPEATLLREADTVIGIGLRNTEVILAGSLPDPSLLVDQVDCGFELGFDAPLVIVDDEAVLGLIEDLLHFEWGAREIAEAHRNLREELLPGWLPGACFAALNDVEWDHGLVLDTGSFCTVGEYIWRASPERPFTGSGNGRFMGTAIPTAVGTALARPGAPLICVMGDGGVRPYGSEIGLAVDLGLPIAFFLMSDGRYGSVAGPRGQRRYSERAVNVSRPSWRAAAEAIGCPAVRVESTAELIVALENWDRAGPLFVEATFDRDAYAAMTARVRS